LTPNTCWSAFEDPLFLRRENCSWATISSLQFHIWMAQCRLEQSPIHLIVSFWFWTVLQYV